MKLRELAQYANDSTKLRITVDGTYVVGYGNKHEIFESPLSDYGEDYGDYEVNSFFVTTAKDCVWLSIDLASKYLVEIWDNPQNDDWAQVAVDKKTQMVTALITGYYENAKHMSYKDAIEFLRGEGYTEFRDTYESWEEYDEAITIGGVYDTL